MKRTSLLKKTFLFLTGMLLILFGSVMIVSAASYKTEMEFNTKNLDQIEAEYHDIGVSDSWELFFTNNYEYTIALDVRYTFQKNGTLSSPPNYTNDFPVNLIPGETKTVRIGYDHYPAGSGSYKVKVSYWATTYNCTGHTWNNGRCTKCYAICSHPAWSSRAEQIPGNATTHKLIKTCKICGLVKKSNQSHVKGKYVPNTATSHKYLCKTCEYVLKTENCSMSSSTIVKSVKLTDFIDKNLKHKETHKCPKCRQSYTRTAKHKLTDNVCTICGFKRIPCGKITDLKFTVSKGQKVNYYVDTYWSTISHKWIYGHYAHYFKTTMNLSFKKQTNVAKVKIQFKNLPASNPYVEKNVLGFRTKTAYKGRLDFYDGDKGKTCTVLITPYSTSGTPGTTVKKSITFR